MDWTDILSVAVAVAVWYFLVAKVLPRFGVHS